MDEIVIDRVVKELRALPENMQRQVLRFAEMLRATTLQGTPGNRLLSFSGIIPPAELDQMREAIEADCEQIDDQDW
ncbi:MAG: hypothetical protein R3C44_10305 [Chloroflexota bacterium]